MVRCTRPQQSRAPRWRRHRRRQFSPPRTAVRIRQSPASLPAVVHSTSPAAAARRTRVAGGAEEPRLARRSRSSKRRRQDACAAPRRRRTHARSRRLSLRLRERLCSPARTPRCPSSSVAAAGLRLQNRRRTTPELAVLVSRGWSTRQAVRLGSGPQCRQSFNCQGRSKLGHSHRLKTRPLEGWVRRAEGERLSSRKPSPCGEA